jgi:hypothetical protein
MAFSPKEVHMNARCAIDLSIAASLRRERFLFDASEGKRFLAAAVQSLTSVPAAGLAILDHWSYEVAAALAQEMSELTGTHVPVRLHGTRIGVSGEHLLSLLRQVWEEVARPSEHLKCVMPDEMVLATDAGVVPVPQCI